MLFAEGPSEKYSSPNNVGSFLFDGRSCDDNCTRKFVSFFYIFLNNLKDRSLKTSQNVSKCLEMSRNVFFCSRFSFKFLHAVVVIRNTYDLKLCSKHKI